MLHEKQDFTDEDYDEFIRCVGHGYQDGRRNESWCGGSDRPFFVDATHASLNGKNLGRLVVCPKCTGEIYKALCNGYEE